MKVLIISAYFPPKAQGVSRFVGDLANFLSSRAQVRVLTLDGRGEVERLSGQEILRIPSRPAVGSYTVNFSLAKLLRSLDSDVNHLFTPFPSAELAYLVAKPRGKLILTRVARTGPGGVSAVLYSICSAKLRSISSRILFLESSQGGEVEELAGLERRDVVSLGVDLQRFKLTSELEARALDIRSKYGGPIVLCMSSLEEENEGLLNLMRAFIDLKALLLVVGGGGLESQYADLAKNLGLSGKVIFLGQLSEDEKKPFIFASDAVAILDEANEASGLLKLEAMACGKLVVSAPEPRGSLQINVDGTTGFYVDPASSYEIAKCLQSVLFNPELRVQLGRNAYARVKDMFNISKVGERIYQVYEEVAESPAGSFEARYAPIQGDEQGIQDPIRYS